MRRKLTLGIQEIIDRNGMKISVWMDGCISKNSLVTALLAKAHILLGKRLCMGIEIRMFL